MTASPRWLDATQQHAWRALLVFRYRGLPLLEHTVKEYDLMMVHYAILVSLSETPDDRIRLTDLANAANLSPSRLTHRLRTLTERDLVRVVDDENDGRVKLAELTPAGRALLEEMAPRHAEDVQRLVFDHLDPAETEALANAMSKVANALCDHDQFETDIC